MSSAGKSRVAHSLWLREQKSTQPNGTLVSPAVAAKLANGNDLADWRDAAWAGAKSEATQMDAAATGQR